MTTFLIVGFLIALVNGQLHHAFQRARETSEALQKSGENSRIVMESAPVAIVAADKDGRIVRINSRAEELFGYQRGELAGQSVEILVPERFRAKHPDARRAFSSSPIGREMGSCRNFYGLRKDGTEVPIEIGLSPTRAEAGISVVCAIVDITARKQADRQAQERNESLERLAHERTAQLESFTYSVSHDLRAPLRSMRGFAQALNEDYGSALDETARDYIARVVSAASRMDALILDLLAYNHLQRRDVRLGAVNLGKTVQEVLNELALELRERGAGVSAGPLDRYVMADRSLLAQVLKNMLSNAIKFVEAGAHPEIRIYCELNGPYVRLWLADNGIGIDPKYHGRIFNVFERLHNSESYPGTGIGLAMARKGIERMGGRIGLESSPGHGSKFWVELREAEREKAQ